ncbi:MAG TPA: hypothetical protein VK034_26660, partial [Enhygromyxa sp.]|nr:hypothetical protein [Enhygromyxa sp.]
QELEIHRILLHHPTRASATIRVDLEGPGLLARASFTVGADGALRDCRALSSAGVGLASFMAAIALHYGEWESGPFSRVFVDLIYLLLGSALFALAWLGGWLLARHRERDGDQRAALRLRRWLTGVGFGLGLVTVGLAVQSRVPSLARDQQAALWLTEIIVVAVSLWTFGGELEHRRRGLQLALAIGLLLIPLVGWSLAGVVEWSATIMALAMIASFRPERVVDLRE